MSNLDIFKLKNTVVIPQKKLRETIKLKWFSHSDVFYRLVSLLSKIRNF